MIIALLHTDRFFLSQGFSERRADWLPITMSSDMLDLAGCVGSTTLLQQDVGSCLRGFCVKCSCCQVLEPPAAAAAEATTVPAAAAAEAPTVLVLPCEAAGNIPTDFALYQQANGPEREVLLMRILEAHPFVKQHEQSTADCPEHTFKCTRHQLDIRYAYLVPRTK